MNSPIDLRADARANRDRLLDVARRSLTDDPAASLNSIAKAAGVGVGTLYRHFPSRETLVVAVNQTAVASLITVAHALTRDYPPVEALRRWCHRLIDHVVRHRGFAETLRAALTLDEQEMTYRPVRDSLDHLLRACAADGVDPAVDAVDLQLLLSFIWQVRTAEGERRAHRVVDIILRGIGATLPLPLDVAVAAR